MDRNLVWSSRKSTESYIFMLGQDGTCHDTIKKDYVRTNYLVDDLMKRVWD